MINILELTGLDPDMAFTVDPEFSEIERNRGQVDIPGVVRDHPSVKRLRGVIKTQRTHLDEYMREVHRIALDENLSDKGRRERLAKAKQEYEAKCAKVDGIVFDGTPEALQGEFPDPGPHQRTPDETALLAALLSTLEGAPWPAVLAEIKQLVVDGQYWAAEKALTRYAIQLVQPTDPQWKMPAAKQGLRDLVEFCNLSTDTPQHQAAAAATDLIQSLQGQYKGLQKSMDDCVKQLEHAAFNGGISNEIRKTIDANFDIAAQLAPDLTEQDGDVSNG